MCLIDEENTTILLISDIYLSKKGNFLQLPLWLKTDLKKRFSDVPTLDFWACYSKQTLLFKGLKNHTLPLDLAPLRVPPHPRGAPGAEQEPQELPRWGGAAGILTCPPGAWHRALSWQDAAGILYMLAINMIQQV